MGLPAGFISFTVANHPKDESMGSRTLMLPDTVFIEKDDFREHDDPKFYGLAPGKEVGAAATERTTPVTARAPCRPLRFFPLYPFSFVAPSACAPASSSHYPR